MEEKKKRTYRRVKRNYVFLMESMVETQMSIRELSRATNIPRSTLHRNLMKVLAIVDDELAIKFIKLLDKNTRERGIKGTNQRWLSKKENREE